MKNKIAEKLLTLGRIIKFFYGRYPKEAFLRDLIFIIVITAEMLAITVAGRFLDATVSVLQGGQEFEFVNYFVTDSFYYLSLGLFLWCIANIGNKIRESIYENIYDKMWKDCELEMLGKISNSNMQDVEDQHFQNIQAFIPVYSISNMMLSYGAFSDIISQTVRLITAFSIMSTDLGWSVGLLIVFALPEVLLSHFGRAKIQIYNNSQMNRMQYTSYLSVLAQDIRNFPELRVDGTFGYINKSYKDEKETYLSGLFFRRKHYWIDRVFSAVSDQLFKYAYIVYILAYAVRNRLSIGSFSALFNYADVVYTSSYHVFNTLSLLDDYLAYASKFFELVHYKGFGDLAQGSIKLPKGTPTLEFQSLDFAYPDDPEKKVLENISLKIEPGEKVVFFGGDGSGKSSIVKVLTGLYEIVAGDYVVGGYSIRELARGELKRKISVTFQNFVNYNFSVERNVTIGSHRRNINRDLYNKALKISGIDEILKDKDFDDKRTLGKYIDGGRELSPGYWQRLAIARMLYRNREIFIMDEPFTFVDGPSKTKILKGILDFVGPKRTLIHITRSAEDLQMFDRIYFFKKGHIVEVGSWKDLMKKKGKLYKEVQSHK